MSELTGVEAKDDSTLVFTLIKPCDYFVSLLSGGVFYAVEATMLQVVITLMLKVLRFLHVVPSSILQSIEQIRSS